MSVKVNTSINLPFEDIIDSLDANQRKEFVDFLIKNVNTYDCINKAIKKEDAETNIEQLITSMDRSDIETTSIIFKCQGYDCYESVGTNSAKPERIDYFFGELREFEWDEYLVLCPSCKEKQEESEARNHADFIAGDRD